MANEHLEYKDWVDIARDAFDTSSSWFDVNIRGEIEKNLRQFQGQHPLGSKYLADAYKNRSRFFRPKTRATVRKSEAVCAGAFFSSEDVVALRAIDDDDEMNVAAADFYKALLQLRLTRPFPHGIPWFLTLVGAYQDAQVSSVVVSKQEWEFGKNGRVDRPRIVLRPVENVRIDPASDWMDPVNSSPYLIDMVPMYVKDIKARMSEYTEPQNRWFKLSDAEIQSAVRRSADTTRMARERRTDSKEQMYKVTDFTIGWVHHCIVSRDGVDYVFDTLGTEFALSAPVPLQKVYFHGVRPYVMGQCTIDTHRIYPEAKVGLLRDTQKELNEVINERRDNVKRILDPRWKALSGKRVDTRSLTRNVPGSVTLMTALADAELIKTDNVTGSSFQEQDRINGDFDELAGNFSASSVQNNRRLNETVGGLDLLSSDADEVGEYELRVFTETWVEPVLRQVILLEREHETDAGILTLAAKAAGITPEEMPVEEFEALVDDLLSKEVVLNVNVGIGTTNPTKQLNRFIAVAKAAKELLAGQVDGRLQTEEVIKELFGKAGYKDGKRFFDLEEQAPDPMQELQRALAEAKLELTQAQTEKARQEAVVKAVEALYSAIQTAQTGVTIPGVMPVADRIARSAGFRDQDEPPIYPQRQVPMIGGGAFPDVRENTSPMFPPEPIGPGEGMMHGIETQRSDGVVQ